MSNIYLWEATESVDLPGDYPQGVIKIACINQHLYLLTVNNDIYHGVITNNSLEVNRLQSKFKDIDSCNGYLYVIDSEGYVYKLDEDWSIVEEIQLIEDFRTCSHGHHFTEFRKKVDKIAVGEFGSLFITECGQLWASGNMPQIDVNQLHPKKVTFFQDRHIESINIGTDFAVIIVSKLVRNEDEDSDECDEDVFVTSCPRCLSLRQSNENFKCLTVKSETDSTSTSSKNSFNKSDHAADFIYSSDNKIEKNIIFRNTEAARDFLTRQFSWMSSAGEEYLAEKPTSIIKENVTNMATLVYEGVKTVGDKVVTLSRHVSGSSDNGECVEMTEDLPLPRITSKDEFLWSFSQLSSERDISDDQEQGNIIVRYGAKLLNREVWTWGNVTHGQLGIGDSIKRERPMIITKLSNVGPLKASVQGSHAAVLTLDGRAYTWGRNDYNQVTIESTVDQSSPRLFISEERIRDVACGFLQTVFLSNHLNLLYIGKQREQIPTILKLHLWQQNDRCHDEVELRMYNNKLQSGSSVLLKDQFVLLNEKQNDHMTDFVIFEQQFLEELLLAHAHLVKPMLKKNFAVGSDYSIYDQLINSFVQVMHFTAANVHSLLECSSGSIYESDIVMFKYVEEHLFIYRKYLKALHDITCIGGFAQISQAIEMSSNLYKFCSKNKSNDQVVRAVLTVPLQKLTSYPALIKATFGKEGCANKWNALVEEQQVKQTEAEQTREFWLNSGKAIEQLRMPHRRLIIQSHKVPLQLQNSGRFSSHWFILLTDILVHISGSTPHIHNLSTVWVKASTEDSYYQNQISLMMPEDFLVLCTPEPEQKAEWLHALQGSIKTVLNKTSNIQPPEIRSAEYTFYKTGFYKDAKYKGRWCSGQMDGNGRLEFSDKRIYTGQLTKNQIHGFGRMEIPSIGIYEGFWKDNQQNGFGILKYSNGDIYKGYFKDGLPHGHGQLKHGSFMASAASVYIGDWVSGSKNGYGVIDDIVSGEKYLGMWFDNKKHGNGLIVTSDGIYYEGSFNQDVLTGHGLMILEDGTHYEGDLKGTGNLNGKGILTLNAGHTIEGVLSGSLNDGIKISNGLLNLTKASPAETCMKPSSFGKLCTPVEQKWKALFRQFYQLFGVPDSAKNRKTPDIQKIWQNIAVLISHSHQGSLKRNGTKRTSEDSINNLDTIPKFGRDYVDAENYKKIKQYLAKAFESIHHPLGSLLSDLTVAYTTTYGGLRAHPLLLTHAVVELHSIIKRLYEIIKLLFPALPSFDKQEPLEADQQSESLGYQHLMYPLILPKVHSPLFILYTLHNKTPDLQYWKRLIEWNKQSDFTLMAFLSVDRKFFVNQEQDVFGSSPVKDQAFLEAIETLQLLKTTFSPMEKLAIIQETFAKMTQIVQMQLGPDYKWNMDDLFPTFLYVVVRARILQLGSEIHFIEDFMELTLENGELGIMFITLKACYQQILQEKTSIN